MISSYSSSLSDTTSWGVSRTTITGSSSLARASRTGSGFAVTEVVSTVALASGDLSGFRWRLWRLTRRCVDAVGALRPSDFGSHGERCAACCVRVPDILAPGAALGFEGAALGFEGAALVLQGAALELEGAALVAAGAALGTDRVGDVLVGTARGALVVGAGALVDCAGTLGGFDG